MLNLGISRGWPLIVAKTPSKLLVSGTGMQNPIGM